MSFGPNPWQQLHWDARAAVNFICGSTGAGTIVAAALAGGPRWAFALGAVFVCAGLAAVAAEIGRPLRSLNVYRHPARSWMTREAMVALVLLALAAAAWAGVPAAGALAGAAGLGYVYCQARMLQAAKGIPAWREPAVVPLLVASGLAEGVGLYALALAATGMAASIGEAVWALAAAALAARGWLWVRWRRRIKTVPRALSAIDAAGHLVNGCTLLALACALAVLLAPLSPALAAWLPLVAGALALAGGWWFKFTLVTRAGFNQGFALPVLPVRGVRRG
jgi:phenylacetyl-CoA:acceptor oxidoreductase subunit 2